MMPALLQVHLSASYASKNVIRNVAFSLSPGESLGLVGTSGAGKTTLVMALLGLLPWRGGTVEGEVLLDGENLLAMNANRARGLRGKKIALIPQSPMTALNSAVSLRTHFEEAWRAHDSSGRSGLHDRLMQLLPDVQLPSHPSFLQARPRQISVGEAQRVLIALALLHRPAILIADEPTSALDPVTQSEIIKLLGRVCRQSSTGLVYISHDLLSVIQLCDRLAVLDEGSIAECFTLQNIGSARHPATQALVRALPIPVGLLLEHRLRLSGKHLLGDKELAPKE